MEIGEAIADHDRALRQRRPDRGSQMIGARRVEEHRLREGAKRLDLSGKKEGADRFGTRRAARFARFDHLMARAPQRSGEAAGLRGFSGAVAALEGDEHALAIRHGANQRFSRRRTALPPASIRASSAWRVSPPCPTDSAANSGTSRMGDSPSAMRRMPTLVPAATGGFKGPS